MKSKNKSFLDERGSNSKKKHTKLHDFYHQNNMFDEAGLVTDKLGNPVNIGDLVHANIKETGALLECEVVEIHAGNTLTVIYDDAVTNEIDTYEVNAWEVKVVNF